MRLLKFFDQIIRALNFLAAFVLGLSTLMLLGDMSGSQKTQMLFIGLVLPACALLLVVSELKPELFDISRHLKGLKQPVGRCLACCLPALILFLDSQTRDTYFSAILFTVGIANLFKNN